MKTWLRLFGVGLATSLTLAAAPSHAENYPSKPIRLIVPFPASGATDLLARAIAQKVGTSMGQQIVVDNRPGAGGAIGSDMAAKAPARRSRQALGAMRASGAPSTRICPRVGA